MSDKEENKTEEDVKNAEAYFDSLTPEEETEEVIFEDTNERALLFGHKSTYADEFQAKMSLIELGELVEAAGGVPVTSILQTSEPIKPATFVGKGKLEEIKKAAEDLNCNLLVCDSELSGKQLKNINERTGIRVIDRSLLILDIFARRATTHEGKLQVELAQLNSRLNRLIGMGQALSRLGGGIGTRGPGETKLETDRRHINRRITFVKRKIEQIKKHRILTRKNREDNLPIIAIVGYTNAGKTTLVNRLCGSSLWAEDLLFATLDPAARRFELDQGSTAIVIDTVGFVRNLPTHLIEAFKSTLEVVLTADLIFHVSDISDTEIDEKEAVVNTILSDLGAQDIPTIRLFNKIDLLPEEDRQNCIGSSHHTIDYIENLPISLYDDTGIDKLYAFLKQWFANKNKEYQLLIPYDKGGAVDQIYQYAKVLERTDKENGVRLRVMFSKKEENLFQAYIQKDIDEMED